eukprot:3360831-Alexandrium_andersonii.AAC.1
MRRSGRAVCLQCEAPLCSCTCEWRPGTGELVIRPGKSVLDMLLRRAPGGPSASAASSAGPVQSEAVEHGVEGEGPPPFRLKCKCCATA